MCQRRYSVWAAYEQKYVTASVGRFSACDGDWRHPVGERRCELLGVVLASLVNFNPNSEKYVQTFKNFLF